MSETNDLCRERRPRRDSRWSRARRSLQRILLRPAPRAHRTEVATQERSCHDDAASDVGVEHGGFEEAAQEAEAEEFLLADFAQLRRESQSRGRPESECPQQDRRRLRQQLQRARQHRLECRNQFLQRKGTKASISEL